MFKGYFLKTIIKHVKTCLIKNLLEKMFVKLTSNFIFNILYSLQS